jgi:hypothetical protein
MPEPPHHHKINSIDSSAFQIPPLVLAYLNELYAYRYARGEGIERVFDMVVPEWWHRSIPAAPMGPVAICTNLHGFDVYYHRGQYHRVTTGGSHTSIYSANDFFEVLPFNGFSYDGVLERLMASQVAQHCAADAPAMIRRQA